MNERLATMTLLSNSDRGLAGPNQDIRGRRVVDRDGEELGKVDGLLTDTDQKKVRMLRVEHGGLFGIGSTPLFIPVEAVERLTDDLVGVDRSRTQAAGAPRYDPDLIDEETFLRNLYEYYGYSPYWMPGYVASGRGFFG